MSPDERGPYESVSTQDTSGERVYSPLAPMDIDYSELWDPAVALRPAGQEGSDIPRADAIADKIRRDQVYGRILLPPSKYHTFRLTALAAAPGLIQVLKVSPGVLHSIVVSGAGTAWVVNFIDAWGAGAPVDTPAFRYLTAMGLGVFMLDFEFERAITITSTGTTAGEMVVAWL